MPLRKTENVAQLTALVALMYGSSSRRGMSSSLAISCSLSLMLSSSSWSRRCPACRLKCEAWLGDEWTSGSGIEFVWTENDKREGERERDVGVSRHFRKIKLLIHVLDCYGCSSVADSGRSSCSILGPCSSDSFRTRRHQTPGQFARDCDLPRTTPTCHESCVSRCRCQFIR